MPESHGNVPISCAQPAACWILLATLLVGSGCSSSNSEATTPPPDDQTTTTINTSNYTTLLAFLFDVINAEPLAPSRETVDTVYGEDIDGVPEDNGLLSETSSVYDPESATVRQTYACGEGGSYVFTNPGHAVGGGSGEFEDCQLGDRIVNGTFVRSHTLVKYVYSPGWATSIDYQDLSLLTESEDASHSLDGSLDEFAGENENSEQWSITRFSWQSSSSDLLLSEATTRRYAGDQADNPDYTDGWKRSLSTRFDVTATQTGNQSLSVVTEQEFITRHRSGSYTSGILQISAEDGSEMRLIADNGNPDTFQVDVSSDGTLSSFTLPWSDEMQLPCLASPDDSETLAHTCQ